MFNEFDKVRIISNGIIGTIVDKSTRCGRTTYIVESDEKHPNVQGRHGDTWPLFDCTEQEIDGVEND